MNPENKEVICRESVILDLLLGCKQCVPNHHGNSHGSNATWYRCNVASLLRDTWQIKYTPFYRNVVKSRTHLTHVIAYETAENYVLNLEYKIILK